MQIGSHRTSTVLRTRCCGVMLMRKRPGSSSRRRPDIGDVLGHPQFCGWRQLVIHRQPSREEPSTGSQALGVLAAHWPRCLSYRRLSACKPPQPGDGSGQSTLPCAHPMYTLP